MFINNTSARISDKATFLVAANTSAINQPSGPDDFLLFPSPTSGKFRIRTSNQHAFTLNLKISSAYGRIILDRQLEMTPSTDSEEIDLAGMPGGVYILALYTGDNVWMKKLVLK